MLQLKLYRKGIGRRFVARDYSDPGWGGKKKVGDEETLQCEAAEVTRVMSNVGKHRTGIHGDATHTRIALERLIRLSLK